jgi:hypothetical protein
MIDAHHHLMDLSHGRVGTTSEGPPRLYTHDDYAALELDAVSQRFGRLKAVDEVSEDDMHRAEKELQRLTDKFVGEVDEMLSPKEQELTEV